MMIEKLMIELISKEILQSTDLINNISALLKSLTPEVTKIETLSSSP